ncbi:MAG: PhoD-like phosphatase, partial [Phormidesmis sp.]
MDNPAGDDALNRLPLLLAGPILRRTEADAVTVWVALKHSCQVQLQILETHHQGAQLGRSILQGQRETTALGQHLHVVAVTARASDQKILSSDRIYAYDLQFTADQSYSLEQALATSSAMPSAPHPSAQSISYFAHQKPTFTLPPEQLSDLKIVHGSCRKPHGAGFDTLPILDCLLERAASSPKDRPHQLFSTGDQIYGDDVADLLLWVATPLGNTLLGWEESLPVNRSHIDDESDHTRPQKLPAGKRDRLATQRAGLTAGLTDKSERVTSHLLSFGEYCAAYLLSHSPACWPTHLPAGRTMTTGRKAIRRWDKDQRNIKQFLRTLWKVRRLLANIPTYTIFDDHDVSDDWNLNQAWCLRVLGKPLGRRTVQNAMLAYAVFQAWGNTPEQFEAGTAGAALLNATQQWSHSAGQDQPAEAAIATHLGLPPADPHTGLPQFIQDKHVWIFKRSSQALTWHYTIRSACHEVIVLDTRTWRGYPIDAPPIAPPSLLSPLAFQQQLDAPLSQISPGPDYATFVVAPTNVFGMRILDRIQQWHLDRRKVFTADVGDSWNLNDAALATLLTTL